MIGDGAKRKHGSSFQEVWSSTCSHLASMTRRLVMEDEPSAHLAIRQLFSFLLHQHRINCTDLCNGTMNGTSSTDTKCSPDSTGTFHRCGLALEFTTTTSDDCRFVWYSSTVLGRLLEKKLKKKTITEFENLHFSCGYMMVCMRLYDQRKFRE